MCNGVRMCVYMIHVCTKSAITTCRNQMDTSKIFETVYIVVGWVVKFSLKSSPDHLFVLNVYYFVFKLVIFFTASHGICDSIAVVYFFLITRLI